MPDPSIPPDDRPASPVTPRPTAESPAGSLKRRLVLSSVLPSGVVAVTGAVATGLVLDGHLDQAYQGGVFGGVALVGALAAAIAGTRASAEARAVTEHWAELSRAADRNRAELAELTRATAEGRAELESLCRRLRAGERPVRQRRPELPPQTGPDALSRLGFEITVARHEAETALLETAASAIGAEHHSRLEQFEVFANLARRLESLVHREIGLLDDLENEVEDPDLLKGLFRVDHLSTRIRRYAENLAVLGGANTHRQWTRPVGLTDVLRSAVAEIDQYARVKLVPPVEGSVSGHAVVDVVHLLAELLENATVFSPPQTTVHVRVEPVAAGVAIEVEDRGLGMSPAERGRMNTVLSAPDKVALGELLQDGRIGLYVVSVLAQRHDIAVRLQSNVYGGTQAVMVLPQALLGPQPTAPAPAPHTAPAPDAEPHDLGEPETVGPRATDTAGIGDPGVSGPGPEPAPALADGDDDRPRLPQRRRQDHAAEVPQPARDAVAAEDTAHDPGLMAAFQTGLRRAEEAETP
ncbi:sensor histidine kinase [Streptomyces sp. NPDC101171]|uniref:sensor histidine kinase n=1 Tax=Streptomyces sp. NPDC101171 TaxID=3366122 RepID=UPI003830BCBC